MRSFVSRVRPAYTPLAASKFIWKFAKFVLYHLYAFFLRNRFESVSADPYRPRYPPIAITRGFPLRTRGSEEENSPFSLLPYCAIRPHAWTPIEARCESEFERITCRIGMTNEHRWQRLIRERRAIVSRTRFRRLRYI